MNLPEILTDDSNEYYSTLWMNFFPFKFSLLVKSEAVSIRQPLSEDSFLWDWFHSLSSDFFSGTLNSKLFMYVTSITLVAKTYVTHVAKTNVTLVAKIYVTHVSKKNLEWKLVKVPFQFLKSLRILLTKKLQRV